MFFGLFVTASLDPRCQILGIASDDALRGVMIVFVSCSISHGAVVDTTAVRSLLVAALRLMPYLVPFVSQLPRTVRFDCAFRDHRVLRLIRDLCQRTCDIVRDAIDAEIPQVSYQFVNAFDLDLNVHVRSKEKGRISFVGNPAFSDKLSLGSGVKYRTCR